MVAQVTKFFISHWKYSFVLDLAAAVYDSYFANHQTGNLKAKIFLIWISW